MEDEVERGIKMEKRKRNLVFWGVIIGLVFAITIVILFAKGNRMREKFAVKESDFGGQEDLFAYTEKLLGIDWGDCIESAAGDVKTEDGMEEWANIRLEIRAGYEEEALDMVQNRFGEPLEPYMLPPYHPFEAELQDGNIQYAFSVFMEGKIEKTREIFLYEVCDDEGHMYFYIWG